MTNLCAHARRLTVILGVNPRAQNVPIETKFWKPLPVTYKFFFHPSGGKYSPKGHNLITFTNPLKCSDVTLLQTISHALEQEHLTDLEEAQTLLPQGFKQLSEAEELDET